MERSKFLYIVVIVLTTILTVSLFTVENTEGKVKLYTQDFGLVWEAAFAALENLQEQIVYQEQFDNGYPKVEFRTGSKEVSPARLKEIVLPKFENIIEDQMGRHLMAIVVRETEIGAFKFTEVKIDPLIILTIGKVENALGGRPLKTNERLEDELFEEIERNLD